MNPIPEAALLAQLENFRRFGYSLNTPSYPNSLPGFRVPMAPPNKTNCCAFVEGLIIPTAARWIPGFNWGLDLHKQAMIMGDDLFSPVECLIESGLAVPIDAAQPIGDWAVVQGWNAERTSGHTFIIVRHERSTDKVLSLEANNAFKLKGVGHRGVGMLDEWPDFDFDARLQESPYTWADFRRRYPEMSACALLVS